jgi:hypothetical protein
MLRSDARRTLAGLALVVLAACGTNPNTVIQAKNYDQHCGKASDCAVVRVGAACVSCAFAFDAVNVDAVDSITHDFDTAASSCGGGTCSTKAAPVENRPICDLAKCIIPSTGTPCTAGVTPCTGAP